MPIDGGGRLTGKAGRYTVGLIDIESAKSPAINEPNTNFGVVRLRRDILKKSYIGFLGTQRTPGRGHDNLLIGSDAVIAEAKRVLRDEMNVAGDELESLGGLFVSRLDLSVSWLLRRAS